MISFSVVRGFLRLCDGIENIDKLGNGRLQAAEHLCDEHFLGRDRRKFLNAVFVEILLLEIRALGHDLVRKGGRFLHRLRKDRRAVWFGGTESGGSVTPTGSDGKFSFKGQLSVYPTGGGVNEVVGMNITIAPTTVITLDDGE